MTGYLLRTDQLCYNSCPLRFFQDNTDKICVACPYDCLTCDINGNCLSCDSAGDFRSLSNYSSRCTPLVGYYDPLSPVALPCVNNCQECKSDVICTYCKPSFHFLNHSCLLTCPVRYIANTPLRICQPCPYDCYTCLSDGSCSSCLPADNRILTTSNSRCRPIDGYYDAEVTVAVVCPSGCTIC